MIRVLEWGVAGLAALGLHLAALAALPAVTSGAVAAGDQGQALVSLTASDAAIAALVQRWETPPDLPPLPPALKAPDLTAGPVALPKLTTIGSVKLPQLAEAPAPEIKPEPQAVPQKPEPKPAPKPKAKPEPKPDPNPEPKPEESSPKSQLSPAQPAQKSAGAGGGEVAGTGGRAAAATLSEGQTEAAMASWGASIRAKVERRKAYPEAAKGAAGKVTLRLAVAANGQLQSVSVAKSSGNAALDQAAVKAVKAAGKFAKAPKGLGASAFTLPISFQP
jgi:protein TonB